MLSNERIGLLAQDVNAYVFGILDNEPELTTQDAGAVALACERTFLANLADSSQDGSRVESFDAPNLDGYSADDLKRLAIVFAHFGFYASKPSCV